MVLSNCFRETSTMDQQRYRRLQAALSLSLFVGCFTSRCSGTLVSGLAAFAGLVVFASLVLFIVSSSSAIHEAIVTTLRKLTGMLVVPVAYRQVARRVLAFCLPTPTLILPSRFQLPPPIPSI